MDGELPDQERRSTGVIAWFVRNRVAANLVFFGVSLGGYLALGGIPHELLPETSSPAVVVRVVVPGAEAGVVEARVLLPLEEALRGIEGVREMTGFAADDAGALTLVLEAGADIRRLGDTVRERVGSLTSLPAEAEDPVVSEIARYREIFRIAVHGAVSDRDLHQAARRVHDAVVAVPGVAAVERLTGWDQELTIEIPERNLTRFGLTFDGVRDAVRLGSADIPAGTARSGAHELTLRTEGAATTAEDFSRIPVITAADGGVVRLGDVATVTDGFAASDREAWMNGEPAVFLSVLLEDGGRLADTTAGAREVIRATQLPDGIRVTPWYFASEDFQGRLDLMVRNGLSGLGLIFLVLFFTLSTRLAVWTAAGLPFTFFGAFLLMPGLGITVNLLSMFGFIVALGIVVDDAIVVGENVQRRMDDGGESREESAIRGTRRVLFPAAFGVLTTMAAFAPLLGIPGVYGELIGDVPRMVIPILAFSLIEAAWILPHHLAHGGLSVRPSRRLARVRGAVQSGFDWTVETVYRPALEWALDNRLATLALGVFALCLAFGLTAGGFVQVVTGSPMDNNIAFVQVKLPAEATSDATRAVVASLDATVDEVREEIRAESGVDVERHRVVLVGQRIPIGVGESFGGQSAELGASVGQIVWRLSPQEDRAGISTRSVADRVRDRIRSAPVDARVSVISDAFGQAADVSLRVRGPDFEGLLAASEALQSGLREVPGVTSVSDDFEGAAPGLVARVPPGESGTGLTAGAVGRQLRQAFHGEEVARLQRGRDEVRVLLRSPRADSGGALGVADMLVRSPDGRLNPLGDIAEVSPAAGQSVIRRVDSLRAVTVLVSVDGRVATPDAVIATARDQVLPGLRERFPGVDFRVAGMAGEAEESQAALARSGLLAVMLIFVLLAIPLGSWTQPFLILAAIPFGLAGAVFGHLIMGINLDSMSLFGMVPLIGIVVNDALVMLDFTNRRRARGLSAREAALQSGPARFRAVILTSVTTCAGVTPLLAERSYQAALLIPMAVSLAFGVAFATLVTLFLVPVLYSLASDVTGTLARRIPAS
ncbi:MAG: efflux RND transporter permease subunit [Acidobacteria bacterium]|nr:efflux RND transporter permease subunit [Acidobacteriota bacterium]MYE43540.1 efflux RND transporter permease subunit [Acidobacteriota bacterium]